MLGGEASQTCEISFVLALPGLRFHMCWVSPGLGFICFGSPGAQVTCVLAFPEIYHLLWLSPVLGFICVGSPRA